MANYELWSNPTVFGLGYDAALGRNDEMTIHNQFLFMIIESGLFGLAVLLLAIFGIIGFGGRGAGPTSSSVRSAWPSSCSWAGGRSTCSTSGSSPSRWASFSWPAHAPPDETRPPPARVPPRARARRCLARVQFDECPVRRGA